MTPMAGADRRDPLVLITSIAKKFPHWDRDELISAGLVGYALALTHFDGRGRFDGYASVRVKHAMQDALRKWYMGSRPPTKGSRYVAPKFEPLAHDYADARELEPRLISKITARQSLQRLSPRLRKAVRLFYFAEYSHREVAEALQIGPDRVAQLLREARQRMAA